MSQRFKPTVDSTTLNRIQPLIHMMFNLSDISSMPGNYIYLHSDVDLNSLRRLNRKVAVEVNNVKKEDGVS